MYSTLAFTSSKCPQNLSPTSSDIPRDRSRRPLSAATAGATIRSMYELELAVICALGLWLLGRFVRVILGLSAATRWGRRRMTRRIVKGYAALLTPEGNDALERFARDLAEDLDAALDASGITHQAVTRRTPAAMRAWRTLRFNSGRREDPDRRGRSASPSRREFVLPCTSGRHPSETADQTPCRHVRVSRTRARHLCAQESESWSQGRTRG